MISAPDIDELLPPDRTLMGPGPSNVHPRVLRAMASPVVGYLDDSFVEVMDDIQAGLRYLFQTQNEYTLAASGTGSAAMEMAFANVVEPTDTVLVPDNGYFGGRMAEMAAIHGGEVVRVDAPWGEPLDPADVESAFERHDPDVFGFVHGETSTGVLQPSVPTLTDIAHEYGALVIADTVPSLGGVEFRTDEWDVDVVYSSSQKCISAPPGAGPITFNERAVEAIRNRNTPVRSWYLELDGVWEYWGEERNYHHTGPISTMYALREALRLIEEEGIEERWARHRRVAGALKAGVEAMGLPLNVADEHWLPSLNAVTVPDGVDDDRIIERLRAEYGIEIVGGLGPLSGDIFRVGCMGHSCRSGNVTDFLLAFGAVLEDEGAAVDPESGYDAAASALQQGTTQ
ncbi:MAG: alanine--glyoxylate aminotransferase family protein [Halodesulfurarchaeum sp.]